MKTEYFIPLSDFNSGFLEKLASTGEWVVFLFRWFEMCMKGFVMGFQKGTELWRVDDNFLKLMHVLFIGENLILHVVDNRREFRLSSNG